MCDCRATRPEHERTPANSSDCVPWCPLWLDCTQSLCAFTSICIWSKAVIHKSFCMQPRRVTHQQRRERLWAGIAKRRVREHGLREHDTSRVVCVHRYIGQVYKAECAYCGYSVACPLPTAYAEIAERLDVELPAVCFQELHEVTLFRRSREEHDCSLAPRLRFSLLVP